MGELKLLPCPFCGKIPKPRIDWDEAEKILQSVIDTKTKAIQNLKKGK
jgi:hypothetical protein